MIYLRTSEDILKFCKDNKIENLSIDHISMSIQKNYGLSFLGYFHSMLDDSFWTYKKRGGSKTKDDKFGASADVLDFLLNSGVFSDSSSEETDENSSYNFAHFNDKIVKLFGKMENGRITEIIAFNTGNYFETSGRRGERVNLTSVDLWF